MQKFSYHTHTNSFGIYDGQNSASEMIKRAEEIGYEEIGISNHLIYHPNISDVHGMFFNDYNKAEKAYKETIDEIRTAAQDSKIKVRVGFEVDFFPSSLWRNDFEKLLKNLDLDYVIGSTHYLRTDDEGKLYNLYDIYFHGLSVSPEEIKTLTPNYWHNIIECIKSGYFDFIAHLDVCKLFNLCQEETWKDEKFQVIETLAEYKQPYELNTSGWTKVKEQHPHLWMLKELNKRNVPVVISDDAHSTAMLGQHYKQAEELLSSINYKNRWAFNK